MAESRIPVDLLNPGQVFACLGILEAADTLLGDATGAFDWSAGDEVTFCVAARGQEPPVDRIMRFLASAEVVARAPNGSASLEKWKKKWGETEFDPPGHPFPFRDPKEPAKLPAVLRASGDAEIAVDHWGDTTRRDSVKFWGGMGGKPGAALLREALEMSRTEMPEHVQDPFALRGPQSSSFRLDWRRDNIPVQDGFSVNEHKASIRMVGFPLVEVLAALGMIHARPMHNPRTKLEYGYGVLGQDARRLLLDPVFHRAALGLNSTPVPGLPFRRFVMRLGWPAKEGQARSITEVLEEEIAG